METSDAQPILRSNALSEIYTQKDDLIASAWDDCLCEDPSECLCKTPTGEHDVRDFGYAKSTGYSLQLEANARRPRDLMSLRGLDIYSAQAAITRDRNRHWPEPTPFFREYLRHFEHNPVEWRSPKYVAYREKQAGIIEKKKPNPWPADIEYHFQRALQLFGGCGRDKEDLGGKLSGCNEWMAWCIFVETGVELHRKKVSSHIQVLKGKLCDNQEWMHFARPSLEAARKESNDKTARRRNGTHQVPLPPAYNSTVQRPMQLVSMQEQRGLLPSSTFQGPKVHTATFTMFWIDITEGTDHPRRQTTSRAHDPSTQHMYTELQSDVPTRPQGFHDMVEWRRRFPDLQFFGEDGCPTPTYLFDAGLKVKDSFSEQNRVVTDLDVCLLHSEGYKDWTTWTQIHEEKNKLDGRPSVQPTEKKGQHTILRRINLEMSYWAKLLGIIGTRLGGVRAQARETGNAMTLETEEKNVQTFLHDLYLSQQMWATCEKTGKRKCFAIFLWRFHMVGSDVAATTNWRPLHFDQTQLPSPEYRIDAKGGNYNAEDSKLPVDTASTHRMQMRLRDDLWDSGRCWKEGSSQLLAEEGTSFPSAESSPTTDLTTDAGSSILSSASTSFALPNAPIAEVFSQTTNPSSFDAYDMAAYCEPFEPSQNRESSAWFQAPVDAPKDDGAILHLPACSPYDATIEQLSLPHEQYNSIFGQLLDPKPLDSLDTPHAEPEAHIPSAGQELLTTNAGIAYADSGQRISSDHNIHIALQYSQSDDQNETTNHHRSPLAGPQSRMPNLLEGYIFSIERDAQRQQHSLEQQQRQHFLQQPCHHQARGQHNRQIEELSDHEDSLDPNMTASIAQSQATDGTLQQDVDLGQDTEPTPDASASNLGIDWQSISYAGPTLPSNAELPAYVSRYAEPTAVEGFQPDVKDWHFVDVGEGMRHERKLHNGMS